MVSTDDVHGFGKKLANQREKLRDADIDDRDREAILEYLNSRDANDDVTTGTLVNHANRLRLSAERASVPLVDAAKTDIDALLVALKREHDLSEGTRRNYRKALRLFCRHLDRAWADDISIGASPDRSVDPDDLLTDEEIEALLEAAANPRDTAVIALLADTGLRVGALASLRIRDLDLSGPTATVTINENGPVKDASGTVPLTWSEGYLANYLAVHPRRDVPDAALLHTHGSYFDDDDDDGALEYRYLTRRIRETADTADVPREKCNAHNFRRTAISRWIREGMSEQAIKHRATWDVDSDMLEVYSGVRDEELNTQILEHYGLETGGGDAVRPDLDNCPRCGTPLRSSMRYCPGCSAALTDLAAAQQDARRDAVVDAIAEADDGDVRQRRNELRGAVDDDPSAHDDPSPVDWRPDSPDSDA